MAMKMLQMRIGDDVVRTLDHLRIDQGLSRAAMVEQLVEEEAERQARQDRLKELTARYQGEPMTRGEA